MNYRLSGLENQCSQTSWILHCPASKLDGRPGDLARQFFFPYTWKARLDNSAWKKKGERKILEADSILYSALQPHGPNWKRSRWWDRGSVTRFPWGFAAFCLFSSLSHWWGSGGSLTSNEVFNRLTLFWLLSGMSFMNWHLADVYLLKLWTTELKLT